MASIRQLLVISSLVIACILVGMLAVGTGLMERKLDMQVQTDGENAAATLALLVSVQPDDDARARVLDLSFQQGRFAQLALSGADGSQIYRADRQPRLAGDPPAWFASLADVNPHRATRQISGVGVLSLELDSRAAREALWAHAVQWTTLALGIAAFWALFLAALMSRVRRSLQDIPDAPEIRLKRGENADAELVDEIGERIAPSVDEQLSPVERLEIELNRDPVTGLANRAYFLNELKRVLRDSKYQGAVSGYVLLMRKRDMARLQNQTERQELDDWLRLLGRRITETLGEFPQAKGLAARLNGADFVVLFPEGGGPETMQPIQKIQEMLESMRVRLDSHNLSRWAMALTDYTSECTAKEVLTRLDVALMCAESANHKEVEFLSHADRDEGFVLMGEASWRTLISQALDHDRLELEVGLVQYQGDDIADRFEATLVLRETDPGQPPIPGSLFMPAATRLGLSSACDMRALCLALGWLGENPGALIIRMSLSSIMDSQYLDEIRKVCEFADQSLLSRLAIELDAFGLMGNHAEIFRQFVNGISGLGMHVGLRSLDRQPDALRLIHEIDLAYVKLGGTFVRELLTSPGGLQMMVAITETAIGMGIRVYVDDADDEAVRKVLIEYGALPRLSSPTVP